MILAYFKFLFLLFIVKDPKRKSLEKLNILNAKRLIQVDLKQRDFVENGTMLHESAIEFKFENELLDQIKEVASTKIESKRKAAEKGVTCLANICFLILKGRKISPEKYLEKSSENSTGLQTGNSTSCIFVLNRNSIFRQHFQPNFRIQHRKYQMAYLNRQSHLFQHMKMASPVTRNRNQRILPQSTSPSKRYVS